MRRLGILILLLCAVTGTAGAADTPQQKFVVFFQEWSAAMDDNALAVITHAAEWVKAHPGNVAHVNGFADPTGSTRDDRDPPGQLHLVVLLCLRLSEVARWPRTRDYSSQKRPRSLAGAQ